MKVLVTGARGQLGRDCVKMLAESNIDVIGIDVDELDLRQLDKVPGAIARYESDWVIHCAAYTQVDRAESEKELAFEVNRDGAQAVAEGVRQSGGKMIYISTDFVFDGNQSVPYMEDVTPEPLSVYGCSKFQGEQAVCNILPEAMIVRTSWVYSVYESNFVRSILRLVSERDSLGVVDDQIGTPSWTVDIVNALMALIKQDASGVIHFSNEGVASWYDFACEVFSLAKLHGFPVKPSSIQPIATASYPTPAARPAYSVLSKVKVRRMLDYDIPHWRTSLSDMMTRLAKS